MWLSLVQCVPTYAGSLYHPFIHCLGPGAHPTNGISIEFEIRPKFAVLWFKIYLTDHNKILHISRQLSVCTKPLPEPMLTLLRHPPGSNFLMSTQTNLYNEFENYTSKIIAVFTWFPGSQMVFYHSAGWTWASSKKTDALPLNKSRRHQLWFSPAASRSRHLWHRHLCKWPQRLCCSRARWDRWTVGRIDSTSNGGSRSSITGENLTCCLGVMRYDMIHVDHHWFG